MGDNAITYSEFIQPDESIANLIKQLETVSIAYDKLQKQIQTDAAKTETVLKKANNTSLESQELTKKQVITAEQLTQANEKLSASQSNNGIELAKLKGIQAEQNNYTKLGLKLNESKIGSYNRLSAQYSLNKIKLNAMSKAQREGTASGKALELQSRKIYEEMNRLQQTTGKHTLSVGNYGRAYNGLNTSVNQLTRELPVMAMNMNTFFLAISNNIPMLVDEIDRIKVASKQAIAAGKTSIPVGKQLVKAIFSWQTAISVGVALLTIYGAKMVKWVGDLMKGTKAIDAQTKALEQLNKAQLEAAKSATKDRLELELVYRATQNSTKGRKKQIEAIKILKAEWPEYFENLSDEEIMAGKAAAAYDALTESILATARARAVQDKITENYAEILDIQQEISDISDKFKKKHPDGFGVTFVGVSGENKATIKMRKKGEEILKLIKINEALMERIDIGDLFGGDKKEAKAAKDETIKLIRDSIDTLLGLREDGAEKDKAIATEKNRREISDLKYKLATDELLTEEGKDAIRTIIKYKAAELTQELAAIDAKELERLKKINDKKIKLFNERMVEEYEAELEGVEQKFDLRMSEIDTLKTTEAEKTRLVLEAEKARIEAILALQTMAGADLTTLQIQTYRNMIKAIDNELGKKVKGKDIYDLLGIPVSNEGKRALSEATKLAIDNVKEFMQVQMDAANENLTAAEEKTDVAQKNVDAEIEARNNGYAYNLTQTQKELDFAKKTEAKALKEQEKAQKAQAALQTLEQAGNLISASAKIWATLGFPFAIPAMAIMWGTFAAAKIKARQVTKESYGEGGFELLEGGSHASGNDIQLGVTAGGKDRRAEGGEMMAIISKSKTRKYKAVLPDVINSLNKGIFEKRYGGAYDTGGMSINVLSDKTDVKNIEDDVKAMRQQNERRFFVDGKGRTIEKYKNLTRTYNAN